MKAKSLLLLLAPLFPACGSAPKAPDENAQSIVQSVAQLHSECVRLTVHATPAGGGAVCAIASTAADKLGMKSDPEDLRAMATGTVQELQEGDNLDITVPIATAAGPNMAAVGVTLAGEITKNRALAVERATEIAKAVEMAMQKSDVHPMK